VDSLGSIIVNTGAEHTFTGRGAGSVIDITLASESLAGNIRDWAVLSGSYNGSDHESISFQTGQPQTTQTATRPSIGWNTAAGIDPDAFRTGLLLARWVHPTTVVVSHPDMAAAEFELLTTEAANFALPAKAVFTKTAVHWWTAEISELRKKCNSTRRILRRTAAWQMHLLRLETPGKRSGLPSRKASHVVGTSCSTPLTATIGASHISWL